MAIYDRLPTYHQIEANNLKGLQGGLVIAQMVADSSIHTADGMIENGTLAQIKVASGKVVGMAAPTSATDPLFIAYTEPLNTVVDGAKFFAVDPEGENARYVQLVPGDEWMSDMEYTLTSGVLSGRIIEVTASTAGAFNDDDWFAVTELPDGTTGHHYVFIK